MHTHIQNNFCIAFSLYQRSEVNDINIEVLGASLHKVPLFLRMHYYLLAVFCNDLFVNAVGSALIS